MVRFLIHRAAAPARALALSPATTSATAATAARLVRPRTAVVLCRALSDGMGGGGSVTYSGGHASSGQGGFYGSGGARANKESGAVQQAGAVAQLEDTNALREAMAEVRFGSVRFGSLARAALRARAAVVCDASSWWCGERRGSHSLAHDQFTARDVMSRVSFFRSRSRCSRNSSRPSTTRSRRALSSSRPPSRSA